MATLAIREVQADDGAAGSLRIGVYENAPKISLDAAGRPQGFFADMIGHLAQTFGWSVTYVPCRWAECLDKLSAGDIDMMPDVAYSDRRAERFQFGHEAVLHSWSYIYSRRGTVLANLDALNGSRVAVLKDSIQHKRLLALSRERGWVLEIVAADTMENALEAVPDGTADHAIINRFFGERFEHDTNLRVARSQIVFLPSPIYFAYAWSFDEELIKRIDAELAYLKSQPGSPYYTSFDRWLSHGHPQLAPSWALWTFGVLSVVLGASFAANAHFRRRVAQARASLEASHIRFRDFAESATDWFWEMDEELRFSYFSDRFEQVTGVQPAKLLGKTREETGIPGVDPEAWRQHLADLHARRPFRHFVHPRVRPDGVTVHLSISGMPVFDETGRFRGYRGTGTDITQQKQAEAALSDAVNEAALANKAKSEFLATMSHDLRTPLNAILGFSDLLRHQLLGALGHARYKGYAEDIHSSAAHLLELVNDLLDLSRIESGNLKLEREPLLLSTVIGGTLRTVEQMAQQAGVTLSLDVSPPEFPYSADRRAIEQISLNLLTNSIKHTAEGGQIRVAVKSLENGSARLSFADNGAGISDELLPNLFEPYVGADPMKAMPQRGHGLGLPICKGLVEAHGGRIEVDSTLGAGTEVTILLPHSESLATCPDAPCEAAKIAGCPLAEALPPAALRAKSA